MTKSMYQEDISIIDFQEPNIRAPKYIIKKLTELKQYSNSWGTLISNSQH